MSHCRFRVNEFDSAHVRNQPQRQWRSSPLHQHHDKNITVSPFPLISQLHIIAIILRLHSTVLSLRGVWVHFASIVSYHLQPPPKYHHQTASNSPLLKTS